MATWKRTGTIYGTAFLLALTCTPRMPRKSSPPDERPPQGGAIDGDLPRRPPPWAKAPPCNIKNDEHLIFGARWQKTSIKPPCTGELYEHQGACFRDIPVAKRVPVGNDE